MNWLNTSGAPVLLLPRRVIREWRGILLQEPRSADAMVDFVDEDGVEWFIHDEFDFANPRTDYDRLCGAFVEGTTELLWPLGPLGDTHTHTHALAISDGADTITWFQDMILTGQEDAPVIAHLSFAPLLELDVRDEAWVLMNSAVAGVQVLGDADDDEWMHATLRPGRYRVERATRDNGAAYRFVSL